MAVKEITGDEVTSSVFVDLVGVIEIETGVELEEIGGRLELRLEEVSEEDSVELLLGDGLCTLEFDVVGVDSLEGSEVVDTGRLLVTELAGVIEELDEVTETAEVVVIVADIVVDVRAEVMHLQTAPAEALADNAVSNPQALVAHGKAAITIELDTAGSH